MKIAPFDPNNTIKAGTLNPGELFTKTIGGTLFMRIEHLCLENHRVAHDKPESQVWYVSLKNGMVSYTYDHIDVYKVRIVGVDKDDTVRYQVEG